MHKSCQSKDECERSLLSKIDFDPSESEAFHGVALALLVAFSGLLRISELPRYGLRMRSFQGMRAFRV